MASVHLPSTLAPLFPGLPRHVDLEAATVAEALDRLDDRWPGIRDRLCASESALRPHIHVYVDKERARELDTPLETGSRIDVVAAISGG